MVRRRGWPPRVFAHLPILFAGKSQGALARRRLHRLSYARSGISCSSGREVMNPVLWRDVRCFLLGLIGMLVAAPAAAAILYAATGGNATDADGGKIYKIDTVAQTVELVYDT